MASSTFDVQITSSSNIYPEGRQLEHGSKCVPLSIVDNSVADFARCAAVWFYGPSDKESSLTSDHLRNSLSKTLNYYPQWCGKLSYIAPKANGNHNERYRRIWVTYNSPEDIGIPFLTATSPKKLSESLPDTEVRKTSLKAWNAASLPSSDLLPSTQLAICSDPSAPNIIIQHTKFPCGSVAIAIQLTHCLADAVGLSQFAKDWSNTSRTLLSGLQAPILSPIFDPQRLDSFAAGDIDASSPDTEIQSYARDLSQHRYDWYKETSIQPRKPDIPDDFDFTVSLSPSNPIPWEQWNYHTPISYRVLHFSKSEIEDIYQLATSTDPGVKISKHDALVAHIWSRITASRNLTTGTTSWLDMTLGLRPRVHPPLPDNFLGSPITHAAIPFIVSASQSTPSLATLASKIRTTISSFTPEAISHYLHDRAFEYDPQRLWGACLGREHVLLTTWVHSGVYDVVFEDGRNPVYVDAVMPYCDGLVEIMEGPNRVEEHGKEDGKGKSWIENGVDVSVYLEEKAMERLLSDEKLWKVELGDSIV